MKRNEVTNQKIADAKNTFGTESGERVLNDLIALSTYNRSAVPPVHGAPIDPYRIAYCEGQRSVILYIKRLLSGSVDFEGINDV